jgi:hypothetical protein
MGNAQSARAQRLQRVDVGSRGKRETPCAKAPNDKARRGVRIRGGIAPTWFVAGLAFVEAATSGSNKTSRGATGDRVISMTQAFRDLPAILGELRHDRFLERDVLFRATVRAGVDVELTRELLPRGQT